MELALAPENHDVVWDDGIKLISSSIRSIPLSTLYVWSPESEDLKAAKHAPLCKDFRPKHCHLKQINFEH
jgi:hypothetical protein